MWRSVAIGVVLAGLLAGCSWTADGGGFSGGSGALYERSPLNASEASRVPLTIRLLKQTTGHVQVVSTDRLRCSPPSGSVQDPAATCGAVQDLLRRYRGRRSYRKCGQSPNASYVVEVYGRAQGKLVGFAVVDGGGNCLRGRRLGRDVGTLSGGLATM